MTILVLSTIIHFYSSSHLTAVTALKQLDNEFESVSASLSQAGRPTVQASSQTCRSSKMPFVWGG